MPRKGQAVSTHPRRMVFLEYLKSLPSEGDCVAWPWTTNAKTYTMISAYGKTTTVHRWVYEQVHGPLPRELETCHACDHPWCVRPGHLWAGTHADNMRDMFAKGRHPKNGPGQPPGEAHWNARLTAADVYAIRRLCANGVSHGVVARSYNVSRPLVSRIHARSVWKHLPDEDPTQAPAAQA